MIVSVLKGGVGNQLFQYAFARSLSIRTGSTLYFDKSWFSTSLAKKTGAIRKIALNDFQVNGKFLPDGYARSITAIAQYLGECTHLKSILDNHVFLIDQNNVFPQLKKLRKNRCSLVLIDGFWQSEDFFSNIKRILRQELILNYALTPQDRKIANEIKTRNSVSLHVRRGDYANSKRTNRRHGVLDMDYYHAAVDRIAGQTKASFIYVFSDDIPWCRENLVFDQPWRLVSDNSRKISSELHIMACCRHHIIANSSFSWWGAWLGEKKGSRIIAPKHWFKSGPELFRIVPERWIRL